MAKVGLPIPGTPPPSQGHSALETVNTVREGSTFCQPKPRQNNRRLEYTSPLFVQALLAQCLSRTMTKKTDTIPAHRVNSRGRKGQRRPARSSHTACGCRRRRKAARGTAGSLCAEPGFAEKRYLEPETEVNLQGESWTERRGIQGPGGEHVPGHSGNLEEPAKQ